MRILLTTESHLPYLSGVTVSVDALARGLTARGHDVLVVAPGPGAGARIVPVGSPGPEPRYAWIPSYQLPRVAPPGYRMPWPLPWTAGLREARAFEADVVHAHSPFVSGLFARRLASVAGAPLVFTHHTRFADYGHYAGPLAPIASRLADAYLRRFWRSCATIIAPSHALVAEIRERLDADRHGSRRREVHVVPTGIDVVGIRAPEPRDPRGEAGWPPDAIVVASLGRLALEKSPIVLLDAFALAARDVDALRLCVIGGGPAEASVRRRAGAPDLAGRVHLAGARPRTDALAMLTASDLFAFTSRTETQGLVLAEALAAGLPAVALEGPGVADSIRDGVDGAIVPHAPDGDDPARLAAALVRLATDADLRRRLAAAARDGADRFSLERRIREVEAVYRAVVA